MDIKKPYLLTLNQDIISLYQKKGKKIYSYAKLMLTSYQSLFHIVNFVVCFSIK